MLYRDRIKTKLTAPFNIGDTTLYVENTNDFPNISNLEPILLVIDNDKHYEIVQAISKTNNSFTVNRISTQKNFEIDSLVYTYPLREHFFFRSSVTSGNLSPNNNSPLANLSEMQYNSFFIGIVYHDTVTIPPYVRIYLTSSSYVEFPSLNNSIGFFLQNVNPTTTTIVVRLFNPNSTSLPYQSIIYYGGIRKIV